MQVVSYFFLPTSLLSIKFINNSSNCVKHSIRLTIVYMLIYYSLDSFLETPEIS